MSRPQRQVGILDIGEPVRRRIARLRFLVARPDPTTLDVHKVREIEAALDCRLDDELLALFASGVGDLIVDAGFDITRVVHRTQVARSRGLSDDLIALGGHPGGLDYYCAERNPEPKSPLLIVEYLCSDRSLRGQPLVEWLDARIELRRDALATGDKDERKIAAKVPSKAVIEQFQPSLIEPKVEDAPRVRRVRHPTFGVGEVLEEIQSGATRKLNVQFAVGKKLLVESVLVPVDD